ncbi:MAG: type II toxin-antitoxin system prevent-host-death family antitoxin [bacterium]
MQSVAISEFQRKGAAKILSQVQKEPITVTQKGEEIAVVVSWKSYQQSLLDQQRRKQDFKKVLNQIKQRPPALSPDIPYERTVIGDSK